MEDRVEEVQGAIANLYEVFGAYRLRSHVTGCPCCVSDSDNEQVHQRSLRSLGEAELTKFAHKAMTTWGVVEDFKYFLPRLLEIQAVHSRFGWVDAEILLSKLRWGDWDSWPGAEREAVVRYLVATWREKLVRVEWDDAVEWLCAIGQAEEDLWPYLERWASDPEVQAMLNLAVFLVEEGNGILLKRKLPSAFWEERRVQMKQVIDWLGSAEVRSALEKAFFDNSTGEEGERLSLAISVQEAIAASGRA